MQLIQKIHHPKLQKITISKLSNLKYFVGLNSLKEIDTKELDEINNIELIIDPTKIILLEFAKLTANPVFLSLFKNIRKLMIWNYCEKIDFV